MNIKIGKYFAEQTKSLRFKVWLYFVLFIAIVFVLMWLFQIVFLEVFYERMKISDTNKAGKKMSENYVSDEIYQQQFKQIAYDNNMCVLVVSFYGQTLYSDDYVMGRNCVLHGPDAHISVSEFITDVDASKDGKIHKKVINPMSNEVTLLYGIKVLKNGRMNYIFLNSPIDPVESTAGILRRQMYIIISIMIAFAIALSMYISNSISKPILNITKSARKLAKGVYDFDVSGGEYFETQELAKALKFAASEISKIDVRQRDLIANVSHDLKTPLTMLKAYAEMIRDLSGDNPEMRAEHLEVIINETDKLTALINDMLDLSKFENGTYTLSKTDFNITDLLKETVNRFSVWTDAKGYEIVLKTDANTTVCCDKIKIGQVIYNLINNALNYTGEDKIVYVRQINRPDSVRIEIEDTGQGISEEDIRLIFEKYYRSENYKRAVKGTGLGLSIVKAILKNHDYVYGVDSVIGKGSTFWFEIKTD
ncbi:MAG: HAMP domain-containing histidine kinase [Ruminococcus sp.]|jgi:signal transduction histidine kinase|nr:HAMP domain-containing histidine kinase [Ruminococcus sp.]